ncbi:DUF488 domain-containing protein [Longimicrobium sp.]|uniref:DUF488 domain-containing protein n=1 Tax=Longimicrobium sp. TaxID=2029185 RepID=UPI002E2EA563|nr:DUF488 domain-containing protein [Longimicrobium sp.]HEX6041684.1 DUF488 domain-containing protein [Longimicrobium sp.]
MHEPLARTQRAGGIAHWGNQIVRLAEARAGERRPPCAAVDRNMRGVDGIAAGGRQVRGRNGMEATTGEDVPAGAVFTIGHSTRTIGEFIALLRENDIQLLVDVRRFPGSRRHPQFGSEALAASLAEAGIAYRHEEALGGRRASDPTAGLSPNTAWRHAAFRAYADYMATAPFRAALARLMEDAAHRRPVVMCAEAVPWRCHRRLITDALLARGVPVFDIIGPGGAAPAVLSPHALVRGDSLTYPATPQADLFGGA